MNVINPPTPPTFTEAYSAASSPVDPSVWEDWDLSAIVPAGKVMALIEITGLVGGAAGSKAGVRANGSAVDRARAFCSDASACIGQFRLEPVELGGSRIVERFAEGAVNRFDFRVVGWM